MDVVLLSNAPIIYTDGSKIDNKFVATFTVIHIGQYIHDCEITLRCLKSVYHAKRAAILYAVEWFLKSNFDTIYSESSSSVHTIFKGFPTYPIVKSIFTEFLALNNSTVIIAG